MSSFYKGKDINIIPEAVNKKMNFRQMGIGEILDESVDIFKNNFKTLIGVIIIPALPLFLLAGISAPFLFYYLNQTIATKASDSAFIPFIIIMVLAVLIALPLFFIVYYLQQAGTTLAVSDITEGNEVKPVDCLKRSLKYILNIFVISIISGTVTGAIVMVGYFLFIAVIMLCIGSAAFVGSSEPSVVLIIIAVILSILIGIAMLAGIMISTAMFSLGPAISVIEKANIGVALNRSFQLIRTNFWRNVGVFSLIYLVIYIVDQMIASLSSLPVFIFMLINKTPEAAPIAINFFSYVGNSFSTILVYPLLYISLVLFYYDIRVRYEGYDLQLLIEKVRQRHSNKVNPPPVYETNNNANSS